MTTPFVHNALGIWDRLVAQARVLMGLHAEALTLRVDGQGAHLDNQGDVHARQRHIQAGGQASANALAAVQQAAVDLRAHLLPMTILGADRMEVHLYPHDTRLSFGPWAYATFLDTTPAQTRTMLAQVWTIAEQDGTGPGTPITPNVARRGAVVRANNPRHAKAIFEVLGESVVAFVPTGRTEARMPGFTLPHSQPFALPDALWNDLWSALAEARTAGIVEGRIALERVQGTHRPLLAYAGLTPQARKQLGDPHTPGFAWDAKRQGAVARLVEAVAALHAACRAAAPVLTALDGWAVDPIAAQDGQYAIDSFQWSRKAQSFQLLGSSGGAQWKGPHPVQLCSEARFRYTLERALGTLATIATVPTRAWTRPYCHFGSGVVPGDTLAQAGLVAAALASGNKPGFVPGAQVTTADFVTPRTPQDVWVEVERF